MVRTSARETLPFLRVRGSHQEIGRAIGETFRTRIQTVVGETIAELHEQGADLQVLRSQLEPNLRVVERVYPGLLQELSSIAEAAQAPFDILFHLNNYGYRPTSVPKLLLSGETYQDNLESEGSSGRCTSVASRGKGKVVVGHTEDSTPIALEDLFLLDATLVDPSQTTSPSDIRFLALNYVYTLAGCAASLNQHGLVMVVDSLPELEFKSGVSRDFTTRALLHCQTIDEAIDELQSMERSSGGSCLFAQGDRITEVEFTPSKMAVIVGGAQAVHTNHYLDLEMSALAREPRVDSVMRLNRALELVNPNMSIEDMKRLLSDRQNFPHSICRERTIGAFIADTAAKQVTVCWGEPASATWTTYHFT